MSGSMDLDSAWGRACGLSQEGLAEGARLVPEATRVHAAAAAIQHLQGCWLI